LALAFFGCCEWRLTLEVEIDHGLVSAKGAEELPEKASGLLTILIPPPLSQPRPIGLAKTRSNPDISLCGVGLFRIVGSAALMGRQNIMAKRQLRPTIL